MSRRCLGLPTLTAFACLQAFYQSGKRDLQDISSLCQCKSGYICFSNLFLKYITQNQFILNNYSHQLNFFALSPSILSLYLTLPLLGSLIALNITINPIIAICGAKYNFNTSFRQQAPSKIKKKAAFSVKKNCTINERTKVPTLPVFLQSFTIFEWLFLEWLKMSPCKQSCVNHNTKETQQAPQNPCQKALIRNTNSWFLVLLLKSWRWQMQRLSHFCTWMFQLLIFQRTWMLVSTQRMLTVLMRLKSLPLQLTPEAWIAHMLSFHPQWYLNLAKQTAKKTYNRTYQKPWTSQKSAERIVATGQQVSPKRKMAAQRKVSPMVSSSTLLTPTVGMEPQTSSFAMKCLQSWYSRGGPIKADGKKLQQPMKSAKANSPEIILYRF